MSRLARPFSEKSVDQWRQQWSRSPVAEERSQALLAMFSLMGDSQESFAASLASLQDVDPDVRSLAAKQLGEWKRRVTLFTCSELRDVTEATSQWDDAHAKATSGLKLSLTDADADVRFEAARALVRWGGNLESARDVLLTLLDAEDTLPLMKWAILSALDASFASPAMTDQESMSPVTRQQREALQSRISVLIAHEQAEIREAASSALVSLGIDPTEFAEILISGLEDEEWVVRQNVAIALGRCRGDALRSLRHRLEQALETATTDDDEGVANAAKAALKSLREQLTENSA